MSTYEHILLALLGEDGTGVLTGLGIDKATAEADITSAMAAASDTHEQKSS